MNKHLRRALEDTTRTLAGIHQDFRCAGATVGRNDWMFLLALTPPVLAAFALTEIGKWAIDELRRQARIRETHPASPSLRGIPTPNELADDWNARPRCPATCLRLGSRLADLDPTLDRSLVRNTLPNGKTVIRARKGGMKGWLANHRVPVTYSTVMRYKKLAQRLRQVLALDDRLPLEWALPGIPSVQPLSAPLATQCENAARRLARLLRENTTLAALTRAVEKALGIVRLVSIRKAPPARRYPSGTSRKNKELSVISRGRRITLAPARVEATKEAMQHILSAGNLAGPALLLQTRLREWLTGRVSAKTS